MKPRLLIVDDDPSILESLAERFGARGYAVTTAASGRDGLERLRAGTDVVLLDLQLPHGDGLSVLRRMAEEGLEATVIVITAHGTVERAVEAMKAGAYDFLEKPFEPELVEETLRRALERSRLLRANRALRDAAADGELVVADAAMEKLVATARRAASWWTASRRATPGRTAAGRAATRWAAARRSTGRTARVARRCVGAIATACRQVVRRQRRAALPAYAAVAGRRQRQCLSVDHGIAEGHLDDAAGTNRHRAHIAPPDGFRRIEIGRLVRVRVAPVDHQ